MEIFADGRIMYFVAFLILISILIIPLTVISAEKKVNERLEELENQEKDKEGSSKSNKKE